MNKKLKTSHLPDYIQLGIVFLFGLIVFSVIGIVLRRINGAVPWDIEGLIVIVRSFVFIGILVALFVTWVRNNKGVYTLTDDAIIVETIGVRKIKKIYPFVNVNSLTMIQGMLGKRYGYGTVKINMDRHENNVVVTIKNAQNPTEILKILHDKTI